MALAYIVTAAVERWAGVARKWILKEQTAEAIRHINRRFYKEL